VRRAVERGSTTARRVSWRTSRDAGDPIDLPDYTLRSFGEPRPTNEGVVALSALLCGLFLFHPFLRFLCLFAAIQRLVNLPFKCGNKFIARKLNLVSSRPIPSECTMRMLASDARTARKPYSIISRS
jgi:hypothetical protein